MSDSAPTATLLEQVLRLSRRGLSVIPVHAPRDGRCGCGDASCNAAGKHPAVRWTTFQRTKASDTELAVWFGNGHLHNVGIVTGAISGLVVVDCDTAEAEAWAAAHLPPTPMSARTAKGCHRYYGHPGGTIRNRARIATRSETLAIDVRGDGGFVVAPPSVHASGVAYTSLGDLPNVSELPAFDPRWLDLHRDGRAGGHANNGDVAIIDGHRNTSLMRTAGQVLRATGDELAVRGALHAINSGRCTPPLEESEVDGISSGVMRYAGRRVCSSFPPLIDDLKMIDRPVAPALVSGWLSAGRLAVVVAAPAVGKSLEVVSKP